jgi:methylenetetrahydrofolate dehydrogenase (NADP+)/methenyltetrahydrofolate cyclohydrolase
MTASLLDGKALAKHLLMSIRQHVIHRREAGFIAPGLAVILVGDDPASQIYVRRKRDACTEVGFNSFAYNLPADVSETQLLDILAELNETPEVHGILVQFPLPHHIDSQKVLESISPNKDVDGFHPYNMGRLVQKKPLLRPCTPAGIITLLAHYQIELHGKHAVVIGASTIVGRPMALEFLMAGCTVTICHKSTQDLAFHVKSADILVTAIGKRDIICSSWLKPGVVAIDVGQNQGADGKLCGDLDFASAAERASWITPVPGGVGPMTVATLMQNTLDCLKDS